MPRLKEAVQAALPLIIGSVASGHGGGGDWIAAAIGGFTGLFAIGTYWTSRFDLDDNHIIHKTGWIFRKDRRIPLVQVQNVSLRQNVLERVFKVATVDVETAAGHGHDLKLSVLSLVDAERFREEILGAAHLSLPDKEKVEEPLVRLNRHDLIYGGLTENHLLQMVVGMFTVGGSLLAVGIKMVAKLPPLAAAFAAVGYVVVLFLGGWLWGAGSYILKYGGFVVHREEKVFRISHGLLNKVQMAIRPSRIEYLRLTTTIPQRLMRRTSLHVGTASSFGEAGVLAPIALFVERHVAYASASDIIPGLDIAKLHWRPFDPVFYRARVFRASIFIAALVALGVWIGVATGGAVAAVVSVMLGFLGLISLTNLGALFLARPENSFAITEDAIVVRQGYFHQNLSAIPLERMENMALSQPWWWRRRRSVTLSVQGMKHRLHVGALQESAVEELMARWRDKIDARERREALAEVAASIEPMEPEPETQVAVP
ncbi:PH domain-containing protein [Fimbriimonas ginsengisoli]|uniref:PH domain-containing protein n=1 Tax=Fimbriimonas ginsengisoli TaxID=1005039 RepID=UPI001D0E29EF|nr:PH domain-containing protein [Fimbriimonas ginsengisoli]